MYLNRVYFSPDFWHPLWNPALTLTLSLTLLSGLGWLFLARRTKRKEFEKRDVYGTDSRKVN